MKYHEASRKFKNKTPHGHLEPKIKQKAAQKRKHEHTTLNVLHACMPLTRLIQTLCHVRDAVERLDHLPHLSHLIDGGIRGGLHSTLVGRVKGDGVALQVPGSNE